MKRPTITLALLLAGLAAPAAAQITATAPLEVYQGFTLIDGTGRPPIEDAAISVRGNSIVTVGSRRELLSGPNAPRDAIVINLGGGYVIPGLIDAHVHLATSPDRPHAEAELHRLLYGGVVAVRDMAGDARALASLARDSRLGEIPAPDVYFSALMAGPSFVTDPKAQAAAVGEVAGQVPWLQAITPETDLVTAVARAKGTYASGIKIYANLDVDEVSAITAEAHRQGMKAWAHSMVFPARPIDVVRAGVDVVSHVCYMAWEAMEEVPQQIHHDMAPQYSLIQAESPVFSELLDEMRQRGTILDATLATYSRRDPEESELDEDQVDQCNTDFARAMVRRVNSEGIRIAAGTDFTTPPDDPFPALYQELEELVTNGGLTPMEAIVAATSTAAATIGIEDRYGTLAHGRPVNFVFLADDPLEDISNLRSVQSVWKNAERFERSAFVPRFSRDEVVATGAAASSPQDLLDAWVEMWRTRDLSRLPQLFVGGDALTYFPSDREGLIEGYDAVREYYEGLGFRPGGLEPDNELWVEDVTIANFGESAVVGGIWYFGSRASRAQAARGPLTVVMARTRSGFRISHVNLGNYAPEGR